MINRQCIALLLLTLLFSTGAAANLAPAEPSNPNPADGATGVSRPATLEVDVSDPDGDAMNISFYNAADDGLIGTDLNVASGSTATTTWNGLSESTTYDWYAVADDGNTTNATNQSATWNFTTEDTSAPSITFTDTPSDPTADKTPHFAGDLSERGDVSYRVDGGSYQNVCGFCRSFSFDTSQLSTGEHTVTVRAIDWWGNENTKSYTFTVADGSEVTFEVAVSRSYPDSGIPIDPDSSVWDTDTDVDFNYSLIHPDGTVYDISNRFEDGVCNFNGDPGWHLGNNYYCGSEVPKSIPTDVTYELQVEWELQGQHSRVLDNSFLIAGDYIWNSQRSSHGGRVQSGVSYGYDFSQDYGGSSVLATCQGSTFQITGISSVTVRCSNGVTRSDRPPVVAFVYNDDTGARIGNSNNGMFSGGCSIHPGVTRNDLFSSTQGYKPQNCNIRWTMDAGGSFNVHTFSNPGNYLVKTDLVNAVSDSPDYICPGSTGGNNLCDIGSLSGDEHGWENLGTHSIKVVDIQLQDQGVSFSNNVIEQGTMIRRTNYQDNITLTWTVKNTGVGRVKLTGFSLSCPAAIDCTPLTSAPLVMEEGEEVVLTAEINPPEDPLTEGDITVEATYDDDYSLGCTPQDTLLHTFRFDEKAPNTTAVVVAGAEQNGWYRTDTDVAITCESTGAACSTTNYKEDGASDQESGSGNYTFPVTVSNEGVQQVEFSSTDTLGNQAPINTLEVKIDKTDPVVDCEACDDPDPVRAGKEIRFAPNIIDQHSGGYNITVCRTASCTDPFCESAAATTCSWTTPEKTYTIEKYCVKAADAAGNIAPVTCQDLVYNFTVKKWAGTSCQQDDECLLGACTNLECSVQALPPPSIEFQPWLREGSKTPR